MFDSLEMLRPVIENQDAYSQLNLEPKTFGLVTLHRPSNVDRPDTLKTSTEALLQIARKLHLVFPIHPRTKKNLKRADLLPDLETSPNITITEPMSYIKFINMLFDARLAITDSGGIQEETTYLGIPCLPR